MTYTITVPEDLVGEATAAKPYSELEQQHYGEIRRLAGELDRLKTESDEAKEASRAAKKRLNEAMVALREFISSGPDMQMKLSFDSKELDHSQDSQAWRYEELSALEISDKLIERLREHNPSIVTIGDLSDFTGDGHELTEVKGVGQTKAESVTDALAEFWRNSEEQNSVEPEPKIGDETYDFSDESLEDDELPDDDEDQDLGNPMLDEI
jgi:hypothetical protein